MSFLTELHHLIQPDLISEMMLQDLHAVQYQHIECEKLMGSILHIPGGPFLGEMFSLLSPSENKEVLLVCDLLKETKKNLTFKGALTH